MFSNLSHFSWRRIETRRERGLARVGRGGKFASDPVDQHAAGWCGSCYIVAAVQCVQDRGRIALERRRRKRFKRAPHLLSIQAVLDTYKERNETQEEAWNGCLGGVPKHVFECLQDGSCPLLSLGAREGLACPFLSGFPRSSPPSSSSSSPPPFRVTRSYRIREGEVKRSLARGGPLVLEVNAATLKSADKDTGVVLDLEARKANHAVCVVGWTTRRGKDDEEEECWIVRNSWGTRRVPVDVPDDPEECVSMDRNDCSVQWEHWTGDPNEQGFCYLPRKYEPLHDDKPWIVAEVVVASGSVSS